MRKKADMLSIKLANFAILARFEHEDFVGLCFVMSAGDIFNETYGLADVFIASCGGDRDDDADNYDDNLGRLFGFLAKD